MTVGLLNAFDRGTRGPVKAVPPVMIEKNEMRFAPRSQFFIDPEQPLDRRALTTFRERIQLANSNLAFTGWRYVPDRRGVASLDRRSPFGRRIATFR